jgi:hypothetical protein
VALVGKYASKKSCKYPEVISATLKESTWSPTQNNLISPDLASSCNSCFLFLSASFVILKANQSKSKIDLFQWSKIIPNTNCKSLECCATATHKHTLSLSIRSLQLKSSLEIRVGRKVTILETHS